MRKFTEIEMKAIKRFSVEMFNLFNVKMTNWKIEDNGNLFITLIFETHGCIFEDTIYVRRQNRMKLTSIVKDFKLSCENHITSFLEQ